MCCIYGKKKRIRRRRSVAFASPRWCARRRRHGRCTGRRVLAAPERYVFVNRYTK